MTTGNEDSGNCSGDFETDEEEEIEPILPKSSKICSDGSKIQHKEIDNAAPLPPSVKRRVKALKKLQFESSILEAKFFREVHDLECKYHKLYVPFYEKRKNIVNGLHEPTDEEAEWPSDDEIEFPECIKQIFRTAYKQDEKGVPDFWLTIFSNVDLLAEMVQSHDIPILKHLTDIEVVNKKKPMNFILNFHFAPNEFFTNSNLTKEYKTKTEGEEDEPFNFGCPLMKCVGCEINWKEGKNVTVKTITEQKKVGEVMKTTKKTVPNYSFFNFFSPPNIPDNFKKEELDDDLTQLLTTDFEIGNYIRGRIVPRAVLYYTGEGCEEEEEDEYDPESCEESDGVDE